MAEAPKQRHSHDPLKTERNMKARQERIKRKMAKGKKANQKAGGEQPANWQDKKYVAKRRCSYERNLAKFRELPAHVKVDLRHSDAAEISGREELRKLQKELRRPSKEKVVMADAVE